LKGEQHRARQVDGRLVRAIRSRPDLRPVYRGADGGVVVVGVGRPLVIGGSRERVGRALEGFDARVVAVAWMLPVSDV
jgi:hypothetical protein